MMIIGVVGVKCKIIRFLVQTSSQLSELSCKQACFKRD